MGLLQGIVDESAEPRANFFVRFAVALPSRGRRCRCLLFASTQTLTPVCRWVAVNSVCLHDLSDSSSYSMSKPRGCTSPPRTARGAHPGTGPGAAAGEGAGPARRSGVGGRRGRKPKACTPAWPRSGRRRTPRQARPAARPAPATGTWRRTTASPDAGRPGALPVRHLPQAEVMTNFM